ncbi:MAG: hypothetical protein KDK25_13980, partial [Leptospiraceae bacterium]|nr:hypothetical protein [Leptospiraceae bacterium]
MYHIAPQQNRPRPGIRADYRKSAVSEKYQAGTAAASGFLYFRIRPLYRLRRSAWFLKIRSLTLLINFSAVFVFPPGLVARPLPEFREFREDRSELKTYLDRATNMQDLDQWRSYV